MTSTHATRTALALALAVTVTLTGCTRAPRPGPSDPSPASTTGLLLDAELLSRALGPTADTLAWTPVTGVGDQAPAPCGDAPTGPTGPVETWRRGPLLAQVRLVTTGTPAEARARANALADSVRECPTWVEAGAQLRSRVVDPSDPAGGAPAAVVARVSRFDGWAHTESAWVIDTVGNRVLSIVVQRTAPDPGGGSMPGRAGTTTTGATSALEDVARTLLTPLRDRAVAHPAPAAT